MLRSGWLLPSHLSIPRPAPHAVDDLARQYRLVGILRPCPGMRNMLESNADARAFQMGPEFLLDRFFAAVDQQSSPYGHTRHTEEVQRREVLIHGVGHGKSHDLLRSPAV